jgi:hypothetical protein
VTLRFFDGLKKLILVKDLQTVQDFLTIYRPGKVVRCSKNKLDRLTLKSSVIYHSDRDDTATLSKDKDVQIRALYQEFKHQHANYKLRIGEKVTAFISLAKDYGNIVSVEKYPGLTGFVLSEQLTASGKKEYKEGQKMKCVVLDMDFEKELLDLSEKLVESSSSKGVAEIKAGH